MPKYRFVVNGELHSLELALDMSRLSMGGYRGEFDGRLMEKPYLRIVGWAPPFEVDVVW